MQPNRVKVGTFTLTESKVYVTDYECAAWSKSVRVEPGTYDVYAYPRPWENDLGHTLYIEAEGEVVHATFQPLFGGVAIPGTKDRGSEEVGRRERASARISTCAMHDEVASGALKLDASLVYALRVPRPQDPDAPPYVFYRFRGSRSLPVDALELSEVAS